MPIRTLAQRNALATAYGTAAPYGALFSGDPGTTGAATNELTGGSPAYARKAANWGAASNSAIVGGTEAFDVASGSTVAYHGLAVSSVPGTADVRDSVALTSQTFSSQGSYSVVPTFTAS
jgi:hypothetical protein